MHQLWQHRNDFYYVLHGPRLKSRVSLRTKDREEAEKRYAQFIAGNSVDMPDSPLVGDILDGYQASRLKAGRTTGERLRSPNSLKYALNALKPKLGNLLPEQLLEPVIKDYAITRGAHNGTILRDIGVLRASLSWAVGNRIIKRDQIPDIHNPVPSPKGRERWLTRQEAEALLAACFAPHLRLFVTVGLMTGARTGAIVELKWDQVDLAKGRIDFGEGHGNKRRAIVPINDDLRRALEAAKLNACSDNVVEYGGKAIKFPKNGFASACMRAQVRGVTPHVLRHTAATWMVMAGISYEEIGKMLGDSAETIEKVYGHHSPDFLQKASNALAFHSAA